MTTNALKNLSVAKRGTAVTFYGVYLRFYRFSKSSFIDKQDVDTLEPAQMMKSLERTKLLFYC